jgi:hypothetical protein
MTREIRDEDAEVLVGELLRGEGHDFFVGRKAVKKNHRASRRARAWLVYVGGHGTSTCSRKNGADLVGFAANEEKAECAKKDARDCLKNLTATHGRNLRRVHIAIAGSDEMGGSRALISA